MFERIAGQFGVIRRPLAAWPPTGAVFIGALLPASHIAPRFSDRTHFKLAYASRAMRGLMIDYARHRRAKKRGGGFHITGASEEVIGEGQSADAEPLERPGEALEALAQVDPALAQLVGLHFFCGFTPADTAALRGISERTVQRDWRKARPLLYHTLGEP